MTAPTALPPEPPARWKGWLREALLLVAMVVVALGVFGWLRGPKLPDQAPEFQLVDLDGGPVTLSGLKGRTVVINFWATWCTPCLAELPTLNAFAEAHPEITVVGIAVDEPGPVRARVARSQLQYPVVLGDRATVEAYGVTSFPTTVVVDAEGQVRWSHTGLLLRPHLEAIAWWASL